MGGEALKKREGLLRARVHGENVLGKTAGSKLKIGKLLVITVAVNRAGDPF